MYLAGELDYRDLVVGEWRLRVLEEKWTPELWLCVLSVIKRQAPSQHPQTVALRFPDRDGGMRLFLKVFHPPSGLSAVKDLLRQSKAFRSLRQGLQLSRAGFLVPQAIAAGEERSQLFLGRSFVLTLEVPGEVVPVFLQRNAIEHPGGILVKDKRRALQCLARQIRRLHELGFVHGDLIPANIIVAKSGDAAFQFYLMDNDRTRRYPSWLPQSIWKRNLIQLNRFPLPGISLQDRMRFFRDYSGRRRWSQANRRLLRWIEVKTRKRRKGCDAADLNVSFRKLMKWDSTVY